MLESVDISRIDEFIESSYLFDKQKSRQGIVAFANDRRIFIHEIIQLFELLRVNSDGSRLILDHNSLFSKLAKPIKLRGFYSKHCLLDQTLYLMRDERNNNKLKYHHKIFWSCFSIYHAYRLYCKASIQHAQMLLHRLKIFTYYQTSNYNWIWDRLGLDDILHNSNLAISEIANVFNTIKKELEIISHQDYEGLVAEDIKKKIKREYGQIFQLCCCLKQLYDQMPCDVSNKRTRTEKETAKKTSPKKEVISIFDNTKRTICEPRPGWELSDDDVEFKASQARLITPNFQSRLEWLNKKTNDGLNFNLEEVVDDNEPSLISLPNNNSLYIHSHYHLYNSRKQLALPSSVYALSLDQYQQIFARLSAEGCRAHAVAARLFLSMIASLSMEDLMKPGFVNDSGLFIVDDEASYIHYRIGVTKGRNSQIRELALNSSDYIRLPLPHEIMKIIMTDKPPTKQEVRDYLLELKAELGLVYLSVRRIQDAIHTVLSRYTQGSNQHVADLLCRINPSDSPALFYSSHSTAELLAIYKRALETLSSVSQNFSLDYIKKQRKLNVGSSFVLKMDAVNDLLKNFREMVLSSSSLNELFNHYSVYVWLVVCLLTGIRPNNGLMGTLDSMDLNKGLMIIDDKPNKGTKSHRVIPMCKSLIETVNCYHDFLQQLRQYHYNNQHVIRQLTKIIGSDLSFIAIVDNTFKEFEAIKRGNVYALLKEIIDINPYFTRHVVRSELERRSTPLPIINAIIGHEKTGLEGLNKYSSLSLNDINLKGKMIFEDIAIELGLDDHQWHTEVQLKLRK